MTKIVAHVRKAGPSRTNARADVDRFRQRKMRRMRLLAERVENEQIKSFEQRPRLVRDVAAVGEIRELPDPQPKNRTFAVKDRDRCDLLAADAERTSDREQFNLGKSAAARRVGV